VLLGAVCVLSAAGVINLYSATSVARGGLSEVYLQQVYWLVLGGILGTLAAVVDYRRFDRASYIAYAVGVGLLLLVFVLGRDIRGSARWINIGGFGFQPSEFMKLFLVVALARYFQWDTKLEKRTLFDFAVPAAITAVPALLVLKQPDLGTGLILILTFVTICSLSRIRWQSLAWLVTVLVVGSPLIYVYGLKNYQRDRITDFLNPEANILGTGWHAHHARIAIGHGGLTGQGFMRGSQNQYLFLPDQHSDFPFAVFAEDWGFLGGVLLLFVYAVLVLAILRIGQTAKDRFGAVLATGVGAIIFWHTFFNLGMVVGILPVVGVTLPLFSAGGSSVLTILIGIGLVYNVALRRESA
jgi:rod shape determining protein RodA